VFSVSGFPPVVGTGTYIVAPVASVFLSSFVPVIAVGAAANVNVASISINLTSPTVSAGFQIYSGELNLFVAPASGEFVVPGKVAA
jgi:hypothetical protein